LARRRGRTTIKTSNATTGRPGFSVRPMKGAFTGRKVGKGVVKNSGVTRMFARDPSKRNATIGTAADINPNTKNAQVRVPSPRIIKARHVTVRGATTAAASATSNSLKKVVNRSTNRRVRVTGGKR
jgi:putative NADH-flavin reductase